jgi:hypothetical protein
MSDRVASRTKREPPPAAPVFCVGFAAVPTSIWPSKTSKSSRSGACAPLAPGWNSTVRTQHAEHKNAKYEYPHAPSSYA